MNISHDAIGYQELGRMLQHDGFITYFKTGPNREPFYPLLVSFAMHLESITPIAFTKIMALFGVLILVGTQILTYIILRHFNIRTSICMLVLIYVGISPALANTAFSLYSEIATYPFVIGIILITHHAYNLLQKNSPMQSLLWGTILGTILTATTLNKAVFECITPAYLLLLCVIFWFNLRTKKNMFALFIFFLSATTTFYAAILTYKSLNQKYNGNFVITSRGSWALYGNTARRMEPLTYKRFLAALTYLPGEGLCNRFFISDDCDFWSFRQSDAMGFQKLGELNAKYPSQPTKVNQELLESTVEKIKRNPLQYSLFCIMESFKMFFWESTKIGFVTYPHWLDRIHNLSLFKDILRLLIALITMVAFFYSFYYAYIHKQMLLTFIILLFSLYMIFYSFFFILTRYALPIAPLGLVCIGYVLNSILPQKKIN